MASCITSQWATAAPQIKLTVTQSSGNDTSATLSWTLQYIASSAASTNKERAYSVKIGGTTVKSGSYNINNKKGTYTIARGTKVINKTTSAQSIAFSCSMAFNLTWDSSYGGTKSASGSISVSKKTSYTVSFNANGGSGAPGSQTKWYGTNLTLSSTKPSRTGYSFLGWSTSASATSATWSAGGTYSENKSDVLYAVWKANTYTVSFNANGGSGAPGSQTKTYGKTLTLSSTKPTRTNYTFKGWGTSASSTTAAYQPGGSYTANASDILYAIWVLAYKKPRITEYSVARCNSDGAANESGTCALVKFNWACDKDVTAMKIEWKTDTASSYSNSITVAATGKSGSVSQVIGSDSIATDSTYDIRITVTDSDSSYNVQTLSGMSFLIDIKSGGKGIAFGKPSELNNVADIGYRTKFSGGILQPILEENTDFDTVLTPNVYSGKDLTNYTYTNAPIKSGTFTLRVESAGPSDQIKQTFMSCDKNTARIWERYYYDSSWGPWKCVEQFTGTILWSGGMHMSDIHTIQLAEKISAQPCGIELVFSEYVDGAPADYSYVSHFVSKKLVAEKLGRGHCFTMCSSNLAYFATKYLYIADDHITGYSGNTSSGTGASGIKYTNNRFVLRYVIGV